MSVAFHRIRVADVRRETAECVSVSFQIPDSLKQAFQFIPGQYLTLKAVISGEEIRRSYSICSGAAENELRVAIKEVPKGKFSTYANRQLKVGNELEVMVPDGKFQVKPAAGHSGNYIFYAAGSGITPVFSMIKSILNTEAGSNVWLYYGNKSTQSTIFKKELDELSAKTGRLKINYIFSQEKSSDSLSSGRIDAGKCAKFYSRDQESLKLDGIWCCGPKDMIEAVKDFYISKGLLHKVHFELFTAGNAVEQKQTTSAGVDSKVTVIIDDVKYDFDLSTSGVSILQGAQNQGADVPFSCKGGVCCTCRAKLLEGTVTMDVNFSLEPDEIERGFILSCQSHPTSERVVVTYDTW